MHYAINKVDGYITGAVAGVSGAISNCTEAEYRTVRQMLLHPPDAPDGHYSRLREDLSWELCPMPEITEEATEGDYIAALAQMGVSL